jgi:hypothetical protein
MTIKSTTAYHQGGAIEAKIENSVPPSPAAGATSWPSILSQTNVGDSFVVPTSVVGTVRNARYKFQNSEGRKFSFRKIAPDQFRCWRIA